MEGSHASQRDDRTHLIVLFPFRKKGAMDNYLKILEESLQKKVTILDRLIEADESLMKRLASGIPELESFDEYLEEKENMTQELDRLDEGFESVFARVEEQLKDHKDQYAQEITRMQKLVREVTGKTTIAQNAEARTRKMVDEYFAKRRKQIRDGRVGTRVASSYFQAQNPLAGWSSSGIMDESK